MHVCSLQHRFNFIYLLNEYYYWVIKPPTRPYLYPSRKSICPLLFADSSARRLPLESRSKRAAGCGHSSLGRPSISHLRYPQAPAASILPSPLEVSLLYCLVCTTSQSAFEQTGTLGFLIQLVIGVCMACNWKLEVYIRWFRGRPPPLLGIWTPPIDLRSTALRTSIKVQPVLKVWE